jgi:hypothetical protein
MIWNCTQRPKLKMLLLRRRICAAPTLDAFWNVLKLRLRSQNEGKAIELKICLVAVIYFLTTALSHTASAPLTIAWDPSEGAATYRVYCFYQRDGQKHLIRYRIKNTQVTIRDFDTTGKRFFQVTAVNKEGLESVKSIGITVRQVSNDGVTSWIQVPADLTVFNGTGSGNYPLGSQVIVSADTPPSGQTFFRWSGDIEILSNPFISKTGATVPSIPVAITAIYQ